jgi:hypothetical protein
MKYLIPIVSIFLLAACGGQQPDTTEENTAENVGWYGEEFEVADALSPAEVAGLMNDSSSNEFIVEGTIEECCQKKGCWIKVDMGNGKSMRVSFKDYGFFVPLDAGGRTMIMKGVAMYDTIDVDFLKHLAEDANATQEEIDDITEPEVAITFEATGVLIK